MGRRRGYYEPEDLGREQDRRDAAHRGRRFVVYLLATDYGHYVGHTAHLGARLRQHQGGEVLSTAGGHPSLRWASRSCATRREAARLEASLKSLRDRRSRRFAELTGVAPVPFDRAGSLPRTLTGRRTRRRREWLGRLLGRELRGVLRSRRRRRAWATLIVAAVDSLSAAAFRGLDASHARRGAPAAPGTDSASAPPTLIGSMSRPTAGRMYWVDATVGRTLRSGPPYRRRTRVRHGAATPVPEVPP